MERRDRTFALPDFPFEPRWFTHPGGLAQHYLDEGRGPTVLMLHGNPTWSFYYRHLVLALRGSHRCVVPDHIGMGWSDKPDDAVYPHTLQRRIDDLDALVDALDLGDRITLVVHDWGGMIGMGWAGRHPERIQRLVILNTAAFPLPDGVKLPLLLRLGRTRPLGALLIRRMNALAVGATRLAVRRPMAADVRRAYLAPYASRQDRLAILRFVQDIAGSADHPGYELARQNARQLARFADHPVFIGWGMADAVFDQRFLAEFEKALPAAEIHRYPDAGHYVLEDARDELVPAIARFLERA
jgi:haloalkane dehalogenase